MKSNLKVVLVLLALSCICLCLNVPASLAQTVVPDRSDPVAATEAASVATAERAGAAASTKSSPDSDGRINTLEETVRLQAVQLEQMRKLMEEQQKTIQ